MFENTPQLARASLAMYLHTLLPEASHKMISSVASVSELLLMQLLELDKKGELAAFGRMSFPEAESLLGDKIQRICNPATNAMEASQQRLLVLGLLAAWQSGILEGYARKDAGSDPSVVLGS